MSKADTCQFLANKIINVNACATISVNRETVRKSMSYHKLLFSCCERKNGNEQATVNCSLIGRSTRKNVNSFLP